MNKGKRGKREEAQRKEKWIEGGRKELRERRRLGSLRRKRREVRGGGRVGYQKVEEEGKEKKEGRRKVEGVG